jgi:hypothetical protein
MIRVWASLGALCPVGSLHLIANWLVAFAEIVLHTKQLEAGGHHAHVVGSRMLNSGYTLRRCAVASVRKGMLCAFLQIEPCFDC